MMRQAWVWAAAAATMLLACGKPGPTTVTGGPGFLTVTLATPNADDGAILFTLSGGGVDSLRSPRRLDSRPVSGGVRVVVTGTIGDGEVARFWVADRDAVGSYVATLEQVARRASFDQRTTTGYTLTVGR